MRLARDHADTLLRFPEPIGNWGCREPKAKSEPPSSGAAAPAGTSFGCLSHGPSWRSTWRSWSSRPDCQPGSPMETRPTRYILKGGKCHRLWAYERHCGKRRLPARAIINSSDVSSKEIMHLSGNGMSLCAVGSQFLFALAHFCCQIPRQAISENVSTDSAIEGRV